MFVDHQQGLLQKRQLAVSPLQSVQEPGYGVCDPQGACKAAVGKQRVQLDMKPAKFVTLRTAGDVQRLQRGLLPYRRKRRLIAGAKVAEFLSLIHI